MSKKIFVIISFLLIFSFTCSKDKQEKSGKSNIKPTKEQKLVKQQTSEYEDNIIEDVTHHSFNYAEIDDLGEPCVDHEYCIDMNVNWSLHFSSFWKHENEENIDISINDSKIIDLDFSISAESCEVISEIVNYPIWVVDAEEFIRDSKKKLSKLIFRQSNDNNFWIEFSEDSNKGVIWAYSAPEFFGKKDESEVAEFLGSDDLTIKHGKYSFQVERDYLEKRINILHFDISVTTPIEGKKTYTSVDAVFSVDSKIKGRLALTLRYDTYKKKYVIEGPGFDVNCDDTDQY